MLFASIFVPDFLLQALFANRPDLKHMAVALVEGQPPTLKVVAANKKAMNAGVEIGLMKGQAEIAGVQVIPRSNEYEQKAHTALLRCARNFSPRVQDKALDLIVIDIDGLKTLFGAPEEIAYKILIALQKETLSVNVGIASNPDTATIAARGMPGTTVISNPKQIGRLPISLLEPGSAILETLQLWGITTLAELGALSSREISQRLGQDGVVLQTLARGQQVNAFITDEDDIDFHEKENFEYSVDLLESLSFVISALLQKICDNLNEYSFATNELDCELRLDPPRVSGQQLSEDQLFHRRTLKLPNPTTDFKTLLRLLQLDLQSHPPASPVMAVSLRAHAVKPRHIQQGLFAPQQPDLDKLEVTLARLAHLVGENEVGSPQLLDSHRSRAYVMAKFYPTESDTKKKSVYTWSPKVSLRLFEPLKRVRMKTRSNIPVQLSFDGKQGEILQHSLPWISSGEWWNELGYGRKEWDVQVRFTDGTTADYRIFINLLTNESFIEGSYD